MKTPTIFLLVIATLILSPLAQAENKLYFPHVAVGKGLTSTIVLLNPSEEDPVTDVKVNWFEQDGSNSPSSPSQISSDIQPLHWRAGGLLDRDTFQVLSVVVTSQGSLSGYIRFRIDGVGMTVASPSTPASRVSFLVQIGEIRTGVAIRNVEEETISVTLSLMNGSETQEMSDPISIPGNGQISRFLNEYLDLSDVLLPFLQAHQSPRRIVVVEALEGEIAVMAVELGSRVGEFSTLPVVTAE